LYYLQLQLRCENIIELRRVFSNFSTVIVPGSISMQTRMSLRGTILDLEAQTATRQLRSNVTLVRVDIYTYIYKTMKIKFYLSYSDTTGGSLLCVYW